MIGAKKQGPYKLIPIGRVRPPHIRMRGENEDVGELAASVRKFGLIHPIVVRPESGHFEIVSGYRRYLACREVGLGEVPAIIREMDLREAVEMRLAENATRVQLTAEQQSQILDQLQNLYLQRERSELEEMIRGEGGAAPRVEIPPPLPTNVSEDPSPTPVFPATGPKEESKYDGDAGSEIVFAGPPVPEPSTPDLLGLEPIDADLESSPVFSGDDTPDPDPKKKSSRRSSRGGSGTIGPPKRRRETTVIEIRDEPKTGPKSDKRTATPAPIQLPPARNTPPPASDRTLLPPAELPPKAEPDPAEPEPQKPTIQLQLEPAHRAEPKKSRKPSPPKKLYARVRRLHNSVSKRAHLEVNLLAGLVGDMITDLEEQSPVEFLDLEYHEPPVRYIPRHSLNVTKLSMFVGRSMGYARDQLVLIALAGLLHDVGFYRVPAYILMKTEPLTVEETRQVYTHPETGAVILSRFPVLQDVILRCVREHHEYPNQHGYPNGLGGDQIHPLARLLMVADTFEALISPRVYKLPCHPYQAMQKLDEGMRTGEYDPQVVEAFTRALSVYPIGSYLRLSTGEIARVVGANAQSPEKPRIQIIADQDMYVVRNQPVLDLSRDAPISFEPISKP